jgi:hypothetical protein
MLSVMAPLVYMTEHSCMTSLYQAKLKSWTNKTNKKVENELELRGFQITFVFAETFEKVSRESLLKGKDHYG